MVGSPRGDAAPYTITLPGEKSDVIGESSGLLEGKRVTDHSVPYGPIARTLSTQEWIEVQTMMGNTGTMKVRPRCLKVGAEGLRVGATVVLQHLEKFRK